MKHIVLVILLSVIGLAACNPQEAPALQATIPSWDEIVVSFGSTEKTYTREDLEALGAVEVDNGDAVYVGVPLKTLLADAGIDLTAITTVEAVAIDGFSSTYDAGIFMADTTLVAYAKADGPLADNEGNFRMVVPGQAGAMNPRLLVKLQAE